jgi:hypothetical protein
MSVEQLSLWEDPKNYKEHVKYKKGIFKSKEELIQQLKGEGKKRIYHVLSFGGGTQSSHLLESHLRDELPYKYDFIVFADTGAEPDFIHDQVKWWQNRQKEYGDKTPFIITHHKSMEGGLEEMLYRYIQTDYQRFQMPLYCNQIDEVTGDEKPAGLLPRQCTTDFKIVPVKQSVRKLVMEELGLSPNQRMPKDVAYIIDIGFSFDEIKRINTYQSPQYKYMYLSYPLVEKGLSTKDSIKFLEENEFPMKRSRCYLCPFNCDNKGIGMDWGEIIRDEGLSFLKACYFDEELRRVQAEGNKNLRSVPYFHYKRIPLKDAYPDDFKRLTALYQDKLNTWKIEWRDYIQKKYAVSKAS